MDHTTPRRGALPFPERRNAQSARKARPVFGAKARPLPLDENLALLATGAAAAKRKAATPKLPAPGSRSNVADAVRRASASQRTPSAASRQQRELDDIRQQLSAARQRAATPRREPFTPVREAPRARAHAPWTAGPRPRPAATLSAPSFATVMLVAQSLVQQARFREADRVFADILAGPSRAEARASARYWLARAHANERMGRHPVVVGLFHRAREARAQPADALAAGFRAFEQRYKKAYPGAALPQAELSRSDEELDDDDDDFGAAAAPTTPMAARPRARAVGTPVADSLRVSFRPTTPAGRVDMPARGLRTPFPSTPAGAAPAAPPCTPAASAVPAPGADDQASLQALLLNALAAYQQLPQRAAVASTPLAAEPGRRVYMSPDSPPSAAPTPEQPAELGTFSDDESEVADEQAEQMEQPKMMMETAPVALDFMLDDEDAPMPDNDDDVEVPAGEEEVLAASLPAIEAPVDASAAGGEEDGDDVVEILSAEEKELLERAAHLGDEPAALAAAAPAPAASLPAVPAYDMVAMKRERMKLSMPRRAAARKGAPAAAAKAAKAAFRPAPVGPAALGEAGSMVVLETVPVATQKSRSLGTAAFLSPVRRSSRFTPKKRLEEGEEEGVRLMLGGDSTFVPNHALDVKKDESMRAVGSIAAVASGKRAVPAPAAPVKHEPKSDDVVRALEALSIRAAAAPAAAGQARCASCNGGSPECAGPAGRNTLCRGCYDSIKKDEGRASASPARSVRKGTPMVRRRPKLGAAARSNKVVDADGFAVPALPPPRKQQKAEPEAAPLTPRRSARLSRGD